MWNAVSRRAGQSVPLAPAFLVRPGSLCDFVAVDQRLVMSRADQSHYPVQQHVAAMNSLRRMNLSPVLPD